MHRLLSSVAAAAFVLSLGAPTFAATSKTSSGGTMTKTMSKCPAGSTWVKGYKTKTGKTVKGYCRKGK